MSTNPAFRNDPAGFFAIQLGTTDAIRIGGASGDNSGQLAGFRNILINGKLSINTRDVTIAAAANGTYGPDRWKKVDASNMTQIVEDGNYKPSSIYTLSGVGVTTQQINSPASGHWTMPSIPISASYIQCELGSIATPFELRPIGFELALCQRYLPSITPGSYYVGLAANPVAVLAPIGFKVTARVPPTGIYIPPGVPVSTTNGASTPIDVSTLVFGAAGVDSAYVVAGVAGGLTAGMASLFKCTTSAILFTGCEL